jgi:hypothetical protein
LLCDAEITIPDGGTAAHRDLAGRRIADLEQDAALSLVKANAIKESLAGVTARKGA